MTRNAIRITTLATVALLGVLTVLLVAGVTAQSPGGSATVTPTPNGKLKASRTVVGIGDTTTITVYDVVPADAGVKLSVSGPLAYGDCDETHNSADRTIPLLFQPPVSVALIGCEPVGSATVKLETLDGAELASLSVRVESASPPIEVSPLDLFPSASSTPRASQ